MWHGMQRELDQDQETQVQVSILPPCDSGQSFLFSGFGFPVCKWGQCLDEKVSGATAAQAF